MYPAPGRSGVARPDLPVASAFNAPGGHFETERAVYPPCAYPAALPQPAPLSESDAIAQEIRRDLPTLVRIAMLLVAGIIAASGVGLIIHTLLAAFK